MPLGRVKQLLRLLLPYFGLESGLRQAEPAPPSAQVLHHAASFIAHPALPQTFAAERPIPQILFNNRLLPPESASVEAQRKADGDYTAAGVQAVALRTKRSRVNRPRDQKLYQDARLRSLYAQESTILDWDETELEFPDITDRATVLELAKLTGNAYSTPDKKGWYEVGEKWNSSVPFGWEEADDGFRGNIFVSADNSTVVLSIKGTSLYGQGPTAGRDKLNDNRLFSCCCARVGFHWAASTVCDCFKGGWSCTQSCLERSLQGDDLFYSIGINLFNNVTYLYPNSNIWITGHSLGGGLSSLIGATFGVPTITFEPPGDRLAASRLHLPHPPPTSDQLARGDLQEPFSLHPIVAIYNTADPVASGTCNGVHISVCQRRLRDGVSMPSREDDCLRHNEAVQMVTVSEHHPIAVMINKVLVDDWEEDLPVPEAMAQTNCIDCFKWDFIDDD